ncbi:hypothetical protein [Nocardioides sp. zg-1230]|uniref:hypothetical protein n=1 Tax=Nocardioides sp. zg-1230 TaxID=2736601 RepID=UPI001555BCAB|nr:hypothetical protein [Nocardioides sp. zg-1230]NPC42033.1 hypothetical protein [Nocardioides sp. zg-1230]
MLVRVALGAATVVVGFLGGVQLHQVVAASDAPPATVAVDPRAHEEDASDGADGADGPEEVVFEDCPLMAMAPPYPENDRGMTYGSGANVDEDDPGPDLVAAYGTNGRCGFIRAADREGDQPRNPEEAAEYMANLDPDGRDIPLYARDGVTVIGWFHIDSPRVLTSGAPEPRRSRP